MDLYSSNINRSLGQYNVISDEVSISQVTDLSLDEYCFARQKYCSLKHCTDCTKCTPLITAARMIQREGICLLSTVFRASFSGSTYNSAIAKQRLLQMPIVAIRIGLRVSGVSDVKIMEVISGVDYIKLQKFLSVHQSNQASASNAPSISKVELQRLLALAQSRREREQLKYAVFKATGISATAARKQLGIYNTAQRASEIKDALEEAGQIRDCIDALSSTQEKAVLQSFGIPESDSECSYSSSESEEYGVILPIAETPSTMSFPDEEQIFKVLQESDWNWFECIDQIEQQMCGAEGEENVQFTAQVEKMYSNLICNTQLQAPEKELLQQSHDAYVAVTAILKERSEREADAFNGYIVED